MKINNIYCIDAIEGLRQLDDESIDLIVTDPPYNKNKDYGEGIDDNKPFEEFDSFNRQWLTECLRVLKEGHHLNFSCAPDQLFYFKNVVEQVGFRFRHMLIWATGECRGHMNKKTWLRSYEPILWCQKEGKSYGLFNNYPLSALDVITVSSPHVHRKGEDKKVHIAQKPMKLFETIIKKCSNENDIVLDPFIGSGVSAIACKKLGRYYIGFEVNPEYVRVWNQRLSVIPSHIKEWL